MLDNENESPAVNAWGAPAVGVGHNELSIMRGRSMCVTCHHPLAAKDLIPILSWVLLGGRCRYCRSPISIQYPIVEALTAVLFVASYAYWPTGFNASGIFGLIIWCFFLTAFMALAVYDLRWFLLPDRIVFPLIALALIYVLLQATIFHGGWEFASHAFAGAALLTGVFLALYVCSQGRWVGFGDVKLTIVLGLLAGSPEKAILLLFVAAMFGTLVAIPLLIKGKATAKTQLPFGPFLLVAAVAVSLFGTSLIHWYLRFFYLR